MTDLRALVEQILTERRAVGERWEAESEGTPEWNRLRDLYNSYDLPLAAHVPQLLDALAGAEKEREKAILRAVERRDKFFNERRIALAAEARLSVAEKEKQELLGDHLALVPVFRGMAEKVGLEPRGYANLDNPANITLNIAERAIVNRLRAESAEARLSKLQELGRRVVERTPGFCGCNACSICAAWDAFKAEILDSR